MTQKGISVGLYLGGINIASYQSQKKCDVLIGTFALSERRIRHTHSGHAGAGVAQNGRGLVGERILEKPRERKTRQLCTT